MANIRLNKYYKKRVENHFRGLSRLTIALRVAKSMEAYDRTNNLLAKHKRLCYISSKVVH